MLSLHVTLKGVDNVLFSRLEVVLTDHLGLFVHMHWPQHGCVSTVAHTEHLMDIGRLT